MHLRRELEMHEQRAREIRTLLGLSKPTGEWLEILVCQAGPMRVAIPLGEVLRAELAARLSPLPDTPVWIAGQLNWHSITVPVIDLARRLGQSERHADPSDRIVICSSNNNLIGFLLQTIYGPARILCSEIEYPPHGMPYTNYFIGSVSHNDEIVHILGTEAMIAFADLPREGSDV